ncbi:MAG TPA: hypothetical protein VKT73_11130 [Xanthobacteraceae bacterium]|nr:hypothetical protein [Xanthobacteraceae bacterium]
MRGLSLLMFAALLCAAPAAHAALLPSCQSVWRAVNAQQQEAWLRQCALAQRQSGAVFDVEDSCRKWFETCRRTPPNATPPGMITH